MIVVSLQLFGGRGGASGGGNSKQEMLAGLNKLKNFGNKNKQTKQYELKENPLYKNATPQEAIAANAIDLQIKGEERLKGEVETVSMENVATTQPWVSKAGIQNGIENPGQHKYSSDYPAGVKYNGKVFLVDGNHRGVISYLRGDKKMKIRIINQTGGKRR
jgi:hypothetical protein